MTSSFNYAATQASRATIAQLPNILIEAILFGTMLILVLVLMFQSGGLDNNLLSQIVPILGLYAFSVARLKPAAYSIYTGLANLRYGRELASNQLSRLKDNNSLVFEEEASLSVFNPETLISMENVSYRYSNTSENTLSGLNVDLPVGSIVGIVGSTGAGKTTFVDILLGLLPPTEGQICIDGTPVSASNIRGWQDIVGYVPQNIFLFDASIKENIAMGISADDVDLNQVKACAQIANIDKFIEQLPDKYNTVVGERGVRFSGGQLQRLGIARALYHKPAILVFDEATSALDKDTEAAVMESIGSLKGNITLIMIAHRLETLRDCDKILVLDRGRMSMETTYEKLYL